MAHTVSAKKRIRQNESHRRRNRWRLRAMRDAIKDLDEQLLHGSPEQITESYKKAAAVIDRIAQKGVIHKNQAARRKSRLNTRVRAKLASN